MSANYITHQIDPNLSLESSARWIGSGIRAGSVTLDEYYGSNSGEYARKLYIGNGGNVVLELLNGDVVFFEGLVTGSTLEVASKRVLTSSGGNSTSATKMIWIS